jgi:hypothetical protein
MTEQNIHPKVLMTGAVQLRILVAVVVVPAAASSTNAATATTTAGKNNEIPLKTSKHRIKMKFKVFKD